MYTRGGARAMGMADALGALEVGRRADVVVAGPTIRRWCRTSTRCVHLALIQGHRGVRTVICDGRVVVDEGEPVTVDRAAVVARARASARAMAERTDLSSRAPCMSEVRLTRVTKTYGLVTASTTCRCISRTGEFTTVLGPSGSGKTTMLSLIAGIG